MATTLLSLVNLAMTFIAMGIMEKAGRRALIMVTWVGMCLGFLTIFLASTVSEQFGLAEDMMASIEVRAQHTAPHISPHLPIIIA